MKGVDGLRQILEETDPVTEETAGGAFDPKADLSRLLTPALSYAVRRAVGFLMAEAEKVSGMKGEIKGEKVYPAGFGAACDFGIGDWSLGVTATWAVGANLLYQLMDYKTKRAIASLHEGPVIFLDSTVEAMAEHITEMFEPHIQKMFEKK